MHGNEHVGVRGARPLDAIAQLEKLVPVTRQDRAHAGFGVDALGQIEGDLRRIRARGKVNATQFRGPAEGNGAQAEQTGSESFAKGLSNHWVRSASCQLIYGLGVSFSTAAYSLSAAAVRRPA